MLFIELDELCPSFFFFFNDKWNFMEAICQKIKAVVALSNMLSYILMILAHLCQASY